MAVSIKRCKTPFGFDVNGMTRVVTSGQLVSSDDAAFKGFPDYFDDVATHVEQQRRLLDRAENAPVEQATATPGEKRLTTRTELPALPVATATATAVNPTIVIKP
jgi:hypothetical protein